MTGRKPGAAPRTGTAYFGNRHAAHADRDLAEIAECCDYVVHTFSETDFLFHKAAVGKLFTASRRRGLEVWADPWGVGGVFGGESLSRFLLDRPELWQVRSDGRRVPMACVNREPFRAFLREWILTAADAGAQTVFWDEPHPYFHWRSEVEGVYACVCDECRRLFRRRHGGRLPDRLDPAAREFRLETLTGFLSEMTAFASRRRLKNALCLYAFEGYDDFDRLWTRLAALPGLDVFGCDPYWRWSSAPWKAFLSPALRRLRGPSDYVRHFAEKVLRETTPRDVGSQVWIQAMRLPAGTEREVGEAVRAAAAAGVSHIAAWSYDGGALLDTVLADRPEVVWREVKKAFVNIRER
jgi:hypothetical protein